MSFPVYNLTQQFKTLQGKIQTLFRPADWKLIGQLQPCHADSADWEPFGVMHPYLTGLIAIEHFAQIAKHREVQVVYHDIRPMGPPFQFLETEVQQISVPGNPPFSVGEIALIWQVDRMPSRDPKHIEIPGFLRLSPALKDNMITLTAPSPWADVLIVPDLHVLISTCINVVTATIDAYSPSVLRGDPPLDISEIVNSAD